MKNFWIQGEYPCASWIGDVTPVLTDPEALIALVRAIYVAGEASRLVLPVGIDAAAEAVRRWETEATVDVFRRLGRADVEAEVSWYDADDRVVTGRVRDLAALLTTLQPNPESISKYSREEGRPPVAFHGGQMKYLDRIPQRASDYRLTFGLSLYSDIWFPYVLGLAHPHLDFGRFLDNRELARRHTGRLNTLIETVESLVVAAGGTWSVDADDSVWPYLPWLSARGIRLDGPTPELLPVELVDVEWPTDED